MRLLSFIYIILGFIISIWSIYKYKKMLNPMTVFLVPWCLMIFGFELKLIKYHDLHFYTYIVVFMSTILYCLGAYIGSINRTLPKNNNGIIPISEEIYKKKLRKVIFISSIIGGTTIIYSIIAIISRYGVNFIFKISQIYGERTLGEFTVNTIPYIGAFIYIAIFAGIFYFLDFGYHPILIIPIALTCLKPFTGGARQGLIDILIMIVIAFLLNKKKKEKIQYNKKKKKRIVIFITILILTGLLVFVTNQRSQYATSSSYNTYASPTFERIIAKIPATYHLYTYVTSPIGVLNAYLDNETFSFGKNTLFPLYNILNKMGFDIPVERYQAFYYVPIRTNLGTAIRELIEDYTLLFAEVFVFLNAFFVGNTYKKLRDNNTLVNKYISSFLFFLTSVSIFMWFLRDANLIIAIIVGYLVFNKMDKYKIESHK